MRVEFQVVKDGTVVYRMDFPADDELRPVDGEWQFSTFSAIALDDFHRQLPQVSLFDETVQMKWVLLNAHRT